MESQAQEEQQLVSTPVLVTSPEMKEKVVQQSSVWWVKTENKQRPFFVISKNIYNHDTKMPTGFWVSKDLNKSESRLSVKISFKDVNGKFQTGWVNVSQMTMVSEEDLYQTFGQSTKGFVYKVMENFTRKIVGNSHYQDDKKRGQRGQGMGRGRQVTYRPRDQEVRQETTQH